MRVAILATLLAITLTPCLAETELRIALYQGFLPSQQSLLTQLQTATASTDLKLTFTDPLPPQRALSMAASGQLDGDVLRQPFAVEGLPSLMKVPVPLAIFEYWVWVPQAKRCPANLDQLKQFKPVGILGLKYFEFAYQLSKVGHEEVTSIPALMEMLKYDRAQYSLASEQSAMAFSHSTGVQIRRCLNDPLVRTFGYFYLNERHRQWLPVLEQALTPLRVDRQP